jgi:chromosomal replication initiator protein
LLRKEITIELASEMLDKLVHTAKKEISIDEIKKIVCEYFELTLDTLLSNTKKREIVLSRQIAMYLSKNHTKHSSAQIGDQIGRKDHTTVLHACKTVKNLIDTNKAFKKTMEDLETRLLSY